MMFGSELVLTVLTAACLAVVATIASWRRRHHVAHALWLIVLMRLVLVPCVPAPILAPSQSESTAPVADGTSATTLTTRPTARSAARIDPVEPAAFSPVPPPPRSLPWWVAPWVTGTVLLLVLGLYRGLSMGRAVRRSRPAPVPLAMLAERAAAAVGLRRAPPVRLVDAAIPPMVFSFLRRPRILLPVALVDRLDDAERLAILTHECAHVARRDHWTRYLEWFATALWWWLPITFWARRALRRTEEHCCDTWVLSCPEVDHRAYASGLLRTVTWLSDRRVRAPFAAVPFGSSADLRRRIDMIVHAPRSLARYPRAAWSSLAIAALFFLVKPVAADNDGPDVADALARLNASLAHYQEHATPGTRSRTDRELEQLLCELTARVDAALVAPVAPDPLLAPAEGADVLESFDVRDLLRVVDGGDTGLLGKLVQDNVLLRNGIRHDTGVLIVRGSQIERRNVRDFLADLRAFSLAPRVTNPVAAPVLDGAASETGDETVLSELRALAERVKAMEASILELRKAQSSSIDKKLEK